MLNPIELDGQYNARASVPDHPAFLLVGEPTQSVPAKNWPLRSISATEEAVMKGLTSFTHTNTGSRS